MRFVIAFCISLFVYLLLIWLFITQFSKIETPPKKMNNHVIKIDIRDIPDPIQSVPSVAPMVKKVVTKTQPITRPKPPVKKVVKKKAIEKKPVKKPIKPKPTPIKKVMKSKVPEMVYIPEPFIKKPVKEEVKKSDDLASFLGTPSPRNSTPTQSFPNPKIEQLYGSSFHNFTPTQKKFIEDNLNEIQRITQNTLTRRGYPESAGRTGQEGTNVVSFDLHPNGDISNLRLKRQIGYRALDENTIELIKTAYKDYPYPNTTTKIIFYVTYSIYGY